MIPIIRFGLVLGIALLQAACSSPAINHYSLLPAEARSPVVAGAVAPVGDPLFIDIQPVGVPVLSDRQEIVVRQGERFIILENERWTSPLSDAMREALGILLTRQLGGRNVSGLIPPAGVPVLRVKVMVRQFEVVSAQRALIDADWSLSRNDGASAARLLCRTRHSVALPAPAQDDARAPVRAYQMAFDALAGQIAATAGHWMNGARVACPVQVD